MLTPSSTKHHQQNPLCPLPKIPRETQLNDWEERTIAYLQAKRQTDRLEQKAPAAKKIRQSTTELSLCHPMRISSSQRRTSSLALHHSLIAVSLCLCVCSSPSVDAFAAAAPQQNRQQQSSVVVIGRVQRSRAAAPPPPHHHRPSPTTLFASRFGVRDKVKRKLSSFRIGRASRDPPEASSDHLQKEKAADKIRSDPSFADSVRENLHIERETAVNYQPFLGVETEVVAVSPNPSVIEPERSAAAQTFTLIKDANSSEESIYNVTLIQPPDRKLTKLENEFRDMLLHFTTYTPRDILSLRDPRTRALFEGIAASADSYPIYRAFEVLFEDLFPLRVAGRVIYGKLKRVMEEAVKQRKEEVNLVLSKTGLDVPEIEETRLIYVTVASQLNGDSYLTLEQLGKTGLADTATEVLGFERVEDLLKRLDHKKEGKLNFVDTMIGLEECAEEMCGLDRCNPKEIMHTILAELIEHPPRGSVYVLDAKRQKFSDRYDEMVASFVEWKGLVPSEGDGRILDVVRGCFVGAKNQKVVDALRIVYMDYSALRLAGDTIFKVVNSLMSRRMAKRSKEA